MDNLFINNEECRKVIDFERYHISESGRIYRTELGMRGSLRDDKKVFISENKIHFAIKNNILRQGFAGLTDTKGKLHYVAVAPLVAFAFGLIEDKLNKKKQAIDYKDGNKKNLHYSNLIIVEKKPTNSKLNREDVKHIKKQIKMGVPLSKIASLFCVSEMQINRIKTGENWGNGKRKIKAPKPPFEIKEGRMRKYLATFDKTETNKSIKKRFVVKRNPDNPTDNLIVGIVKGYKLSLKHTNITRARQAVEKLNEYFYKGTS